MVYLACFFGSFILLYLGTQNSSIKNYREASKLKIRDWFFIINGLLIPIILATLRDPIVGSDTEYYAVPFFNQALRSNNLLNYIASLTKDKGYLALNYLVTRFTNNIGWIFFFSETIIICYMFAACWQFREKISPALAMLFFYFIMYNMTLSTIRQCMAMSVCFFAIAYAINHKFEKMIISIVHLIAAYFFHSTALFAFLILFLYRYIYFRKVNLYKIILLSITAAMFAELFADRFVSIVVNIASAFGSTYGRDISAYRTNEIGAGGYKSLIIIGVISLVVSYFLMKNDWKIKDLVPMGKFFLTTNIIYVMFMLVASNITFVPRMMYYIEIMWCIPLAGSKYIFKKGKSKILGVLGVLLMVIMFWTYFYIISNVHETYPYVLR